MISVDRESLICTDLCKTSHSLNAGELWMLFNINVIIFTRLHLQALIAMFKTN